jgi:formylglycine-generating enzyme required for sulfatase activity
LIGVVGPAGHWRGAPGLEKELVYVVQTDAGQETLTPEGFAKKYGWKNDPAKAVPKAGGQPEGIRPKIEGGKPEAATSSFIGTDGNWKLPPAAPPPAIAPFDAQKAKEHQEGWAKHLGVPVEITNFIGMKLVLVPPGEFMMGNVQGQTNEKPVHKVSITRPFYLGKYKVTVAQFRQFVEATKYQTEAEKYNNGVAPTIGGWRPVAGVNWRSPTFPQQDDHPVCVVSWEDIEEFCAWASKQTGSTVYLPTEAQWEYACRAGTTTRFNTGDSDEDLDQAAWTVRNSGQHTHPVGQKKPNNFGLYDMHGNVYDMVQDYFSADYYAGSPVADPQGSPGGGQRLIRGGGWGDGSNYCSSAGRHVIDPEAASGNGFRVACQIASKAAGRATAPSTGHSLGSTQSSTSPRTPVSNPQSSVPPPTVAPFDAAKAKGHQGAGTTAGQPQTLDLLAITDPVKDRVPVTLGDLSKANAWERRGTSLVYLSDGRSGKIAPPVAIRAGAYQIEVEFERLSGGGRPGLHVDLPLDAPRILPMNFDNDKIKMINMQAGDPWPANRGTRARVVVRLNRGTGGTPDHLTVRVDGELVVNWQGDINSVAQRGEPHPDFPGQPVTSLYSPKGSYEVRFWQLRIFDGSASVLRSGTSIHAPESTIRVPARGNPPPPAIAPFDEKKAKEHQEAWAKHLGVPVEMTNSIGMKLVLVPPGEFEMGSPKELIEEEMRAHAAENWYTDQLPGEGPQHRVRITKPFYLGMYEVTQGEYERVMGSNPAGFSATGQHKDRVAGQDTKQFPVDCVSWDDAVDFCRKLSEMPEEKGSGRRYRLPWEAQWEYACRAGSTGRYGFSSARNSIPKEDEGAELSGYGWFDGNSGWITHAVGGKRPSAWGLYDMHGNVWEWCKDCYDRDYYAKSPTDHPAGPLGGLERVARGGSWDSPARGCRSAFRCVYWSSSRYFNTGFRASLVLADK